jgi:hypothetical protein
MEGKAMKTQMCRQMDLFVTPARPFDLSDAERQKAVELLQVLLTEAITRSSGERPIGGRKRADNE